MVVAACRVSATSGPDDLRTDPDFPHLAGALEALGLQCHQRAWDDPKVPWDAYRAVVVRSTWDAAERPEEFTRWAREVAGLTTLLNPFPALEWSIDKGYLMDLAGLGVPVVPTRVAAPGEPWGVPEGEFVIKPSISAGGRYTARYQLDEIDQARAHVLHLHGAGRSVLVQPYLGAVETVRELKMVYIDGTFSHAARVGPILEPGVAFSDRLMLGDVQPVASAPSPAELAVAAQALGAARRHLGCELPYARVDLVPEPSGAPVVMELELVEPFLYLGLAPGSAGRLAEAVARSLRPM